jgi:hypothetical protein
MNKLGLARGFFCALAFANLNMVAALASAQSPQDIAAELKACANIAGATESLACFKQLAARTAPSPIAPPAPPVSAAAPPVSQPSPVVAPKESFGLHAAEHPAAPKTEASHTAKIVGLGSTGSGRPTVTLEDGGLWQLDAADPLLAEGNSVIITRGTFGSFLLTTPTGRTHRVQRLH